MVTDWVLALLPWLIGFPLLIAAVGWVWWGRSRAKAELWQSVDRRFGPQVSGDPQAPWSRFSVVAGDLRVTAPGSVTTGMLQSGAMRVDTTASLPDLMVIPEVSRVMLFGLNGTRPIPTGTASFDAHWRVMPVAGEASAAAPAGAYVSWARPDVVEALRRLDTPMLQVASGQLTLTMPPVNLLGVDLATRVVRTITALSQGRSPPALALPQESVSAANGGAPFGPMMMVGAMSVFLLFALPMLLSLGHLIPGSSAIACPDGGSYEQYCRYDSCSSSVRAAHRYQVGCVVEGRSGLTFRPAADAVSTLNIVWMLGGLVASPLAFLWVVGAAGRNSARAARRLLEQGT